MPWHSFADAGNRNIISPSRTSVTPALNIYCSSDCSRSVSFSRSARCAICSRYVRRATHFGKTSNLACLLGDSTLHSTSRSSLSQQIFTRFARKAKRSTGHNRVCCEPGSGHGSWRARNTFGGRDLRTLRVPIGLKRHLILLPAPQPFSLAH